LKKRVENKYEKLLKKKKNVVNILNYKRVRKVTSRDACILSSEKRQKKMKEKEKN